VLQVANPGSLPPQHHIKKQLSTRRMAGIQRLEVQKIAKVFIFPTLL
jgi:hypothetical protein